MNFDKKTLIIFGIFVLVIGLFMYYQLTKGIEAANSLLEPINRH